MRKSGKWVGVILVLMAALLAACAGAAEDAGESAEETDEHDDMDDMMGAGHTEHIETPPEYADLTNPLEGDAAAIAAGEQIYETSCAVCHGEEGRGDGPSAAGADPAPADFTDSAMMSNMTDGYMFWRITEGGQMEPFNSIMPPWKDVLSEDERWQVIAYIRSLE